MLDDKAQDLIFRDAHTPQGFLDTPVTDDKLKQVYDLMKWGPTSANQLPARIVWCVSQEARDKLADCASATNAPKIRRAPVAVIVGMDENFHEHLPELYPVTDARSWFADDAALRHESAFRNSSLQGAYLIIAARALGLGAGPMSGFDNAKVDQNFFVDQPGYKSNFIATLGYGDPATLRPRGPRPEFGKFNRID